MMWAATVRRCPTRHARHPSQFGARLQLARTLAQAPYLISYPASTGHPSHFDHELSLPSYHLACGDHVAQPLRDSSVVCDHVIDCDIGQPLEATPYTHGPMSRDVTYPQPYGHPNPTQPPVAIISSCESRERPQTSSQPRNLREGAVRVELPYTRRELETEEDIPLGDRVIRHFDDNWGQRDAPEDDGLVGVGLSYQQRSLGDNRAPYTEEVWGSVDCGGNRPHLLRRGKVRELVRTMFVVTLSCTFITVVVMTFMVYNMLITTLFLVFLLSTVSLLIFLLMRRPTCFPCCKDSFDVPNNNDEGSTIQERSTTYLTESQGGGIKKRLSDSPPPYESPPDYYSLPQEVLVNARSLRISESGSEGFQVRTHNGNPDQPPLSMCPPLSSGNPPVPERHGSNRRGFVAHTSSSTSPLLSTSGKASLPTLSPSPPSTSPPLCAAGAVLGGLASSCRLAAHYSHSEVPHAPPPPSYECVMLQTGKVKRLSATSKPC